MKKLASGSIDAIICDPIYPEVNREYGKISEKDWHAMMREVVAQARRVLKPKGSAVFILGPNSERVGKMRLWLWDFVAWAGREVGLVQDCYWWAVDVMPLGAIKRGQGLMRPSVKMCVWLGPPDCYRNQDAVLWTPSDELSARHRSDIALRTGPSGKTYRNSTIAKAADERGGTTPFNLLPIAVGGSSGAGHQHPAVTPYDLAAWWCRYILPPGGVLLDPMVGSGTMILAGLDHGASRVIGIDRVAKYLRVARKRIEEG
jgi:DNA modification methylase